MTSKKRLWDALSFKYRHDIKRIAEPLYQQLHFAAFGLTILLRSGKKAWLSTATRRSLVAINEGLDRSEILLDYDFINQSRVIFPEEFVAYDALQKKNTDLRQAEGFFRAYASSYFCEDCCILLTYNVNEKPLYPQQIYNHTIEVVLQVAMELLNSLAFAFIEQLPELMHARILHDTHYQQNIFYKKSIPMQLEPLTDKEKAILYWSARGKTAEEIASILHLSKNTVDTYRRHIINKLNVTNITQAVYLALNGQIII